MTLNDLYAKPNCKLLDHLLDVGYIAEALMTIGRAKTMVQSITDIIKVTDIVTSISWLCAVHDIGKAHPDFVSKMYPNYPELADIYTKLKDEHKVIDKTENTFRHERYSRDIIKNYFSNNGYPIESEQFADLVAYHHQGKTENDFSDKITLKDEDWLNIHKEIFNEIDKHWHFDKQFSENYQYVNGVNYSILSIMVTADWIASGSKWHELTTINSDKKECAKQFITENELLYIPMKDRFANIKWEDIFDFEQNELQKQAKIASNLKPDIMIVEYPCGGGKTEASLISAINMGSEKSGIYIATPTMSTAKGMTIRMNELAQKANLGLVIPEYDNSVLWSEDDLSKIPTELWVSKSRHRMLYPFAVGTVDQILKTMLYYRYSCIGLMGLSDKVIIIDEVHAYDSYMLTEIKMLLKWAKFLQIPVILLSATLPTLTKLDLLKSVGYKEKELPNATEYPLITTYKDNQCQCFPVLCEGKKLKLNVIETNNYFHTWDNIISKDYNGCTAFIEGTVDNTWRLFRMAQNYDLSPFMFNGRDTLEHKEQKTIKLIEQLGKDRTNRPQKLTITATPIIEQSLDIDLDRMFTSVAPIDLLIQRFGRVWRHSDIGTIREIETIDNPLTVIISTDLSDMPTKIYGEQLLLNTIQVLKSLTEIDTVKDARWLIDTVYDNLNLIKKPQEIISAGFNSIASPNEDAMFDNDNTQYARFSQLQNATRFETYPMVSIAIVEPSDIEDITYETIRKIMRQNVVSISAYKATHLRTDYITIDNKLIQDVNIYMKDDLTIKHIELTEYGLKWYNN